jgi:hypothetical protein
LLSGGYDVERLLDVDLLWSSERVVEFGSTLDWNKVLTELRSKLTPAGSAAPRGE